MSISALQVFACKTLEGIHHKSKATFDLELPDVEVVHRHQPELFQDARELLRAKEVEPVLELLERVDVQKRVGELALEKGVLESLVDLGDLLLVGAEEVEEHHQRQDQEPQDAAQDAGVADQPRALVLGVLQVLEVEVGAQTGEVLVEAGRKAVLDLLEDALLLWLDDTLLVDREQVLVVVDVRLLDEVDLGHAGEGELIQVVLLRLELVRVGQLTAPENALVVEARVPLLGGRLLVGDADALEPRVPVPVDPL